MPTITRHSNLRQVSRQQALSQMIARTQQQITEGRIVRSSDDPAGWAAASQIDRAAQNRAAWTANTNALNADAQTASATLAAIRDQLATAKALMIQSGGPSGSGSGATAIAAELTGIGETLARLLATRAMDGTALFASGMPRAVPVGDGQTLDAAPDFGAVAGMGPANILSIVGQAATTAAADGDPAASLMALSGAMETLTLREAEQGVRMQRIAGRNDALSAEALRDSEARSAITDADVAEALVRITNGLTTLDAARSTFARMTQRTLFDVLR